MTQLNSDLLANKEQDLLAILCIYRNTWLQQKIGLNGITKIPGKEMLEILLRFRWNLREICFLFIDV